MAKTPVVVNRDQHEVPVTKPRSAASVNHDIAALLAALNFAHDAGSVTSDMAWRVALRPTRYRHGCTAAGQLKERLRSPGKDDPVRPCPDA